MNKISLATVEDLERLNSKFQKLVTAAEKQCDERDDIILEWMRQLHSNVKDDLNRRTIAFETMTRLVTKLAGTIESQQLENMNED